MNIRWNATERRFEAEFSSDFQGDLAAVKTAKFRTTGPPDWLWCAEKIPAIIKLRENRPASGLTITPEALEIYTQMAALYEANEAVKKQLADARKAQKKIQKDLDSADDRAARLLSHAEGVLSPESQAFIAWHEAWGAGTLPPKPVSTWVCPIVIIRVDTGVRCMDCGDQVEFYECQDPPLCLWCEKMRDEELARLFPEISS